MPARALYAGTFDPPTMGHLDLIRRARALFSGVVVAIVVNPDKKPLFSADERKEMLATALGDLDGVEILVFAGLAIDQARARNCKVLVRGVRTAADFEAEMTMALTNRRLAPEIDTIFLPPAAAYSWLSSRLVKEVVRNGGSVGDFLYPGVEERLRERLKRQAGGSN